jgi:hypothetical protein
MAKTPAKHDPTSVMTGQWPTLLTATAAEIDRVLTQDVSNWRVTARPPVIQMAQLSLFGRMVLKSAAPEVWLNIYVEYGQIEQGLEKTYEASKNAWAKALKAKSHAGRLKALGDLGAVQRPAKKLVQVVEKNLGLRGPGLPDLGVPDVQQAISTWTAQVAALVGPKVSAMPDPSPALLATVAVASLAGGVGTRTTLTDNEVSLARIACRLGSKKATADDREPKATQKARKTLRELAEHLPKQRA